MRQQPQQIRLGFLIVLTLVVMLFGAANLLRTYRRGQERTQERTTMARTEEELRPYAEAALRAEREEVVRFARDESGWPRRDAAALEVQLRRLIDLGNLPPARGLSSQRAAESAGIQQNLARLQAGQPAIFPLGQPFLRAYRSPVDGELRPYGVLVAQGYSDAYSYPLIVSLPEGATDLDQFQATPRYGGAISVLAIPAGRGDYGVGIEELVALLGDVGQTYSIDPERVYLVGRGRGADAAWQAAVSYPALFAGLVLFSITESCAAVPPDMPSAALAPAGLQQMIRFAASSSCPAAYSKNLAHVRVVLLQSAGGNRAALETARALAQSLRGTGAGIEYLEFPLTLAEPFPAWTEQYAVADVMSHSGTQRPEDIYFQTATMRNRDAWWVRLDAGGDDPARFSSVRGQVKDKIAEVTTDNISALTILPESLPQGVRVVRVDGMQFDAPSRPLNLNCREGFWRTGEGKGLAKREGLSGPFSDVLRDPFLIVYGTAGKDDLLKQLSHSEADGLAADWQRRHSLHVEVKPDAEVTPADRARLNLLLVGGPAVNSISAEFADSLPVRLQGKQVLVGQKAYDGEDLGMLVCYPNPANPDHMVAMVAGTTPAALYQALNRLSWCSTDGYKWFDYAVFDSRTAGPGSCLALGIFDSRWGLPTAKAGAEWSALPAAREGLLPQHFPELPFARQSQEAQVSLSDVQPAGMDEPCGGVAFDRTRAGGPIRLGTTDFKRGLGVSVPSSITYVLGVGFKSFTATAGVTSAPAGASAVVFELRGDGELLKTSLPLKADQTSADAGRIEASVTGVVTITLTVRTEKGEAAPGVDCVWADAAVSR